MEHEDEVRKVIDSARDDIGNVIGESRGDIAVTWGISTTAHLDVGRRLVHGVAGNYCRENILISVAGSSRTGSNGATTVDLRDYFCVRGGDPDSHYFRSPFNVVATPRTATPAFLTVMTSLEGDGRIATFTAYSWDASGNALADVPFHWLCQVPTGYHGT